MIALKPICQTSFACIVAMLFILWYMLTWGENKSFHELVTATLLDIVRNDNT